MNSPETKQTKHNPLYPAQKDYTKEKHLRQQHPTKKTKAKNNTKNQLKKKYNNSRFK